MSNGPIEGTQQGRDTCLCFAVQRAARALARRFDAAFKPLDITNWQFSLLLALSRIKALNRPTPPSLGFVAELLAMDRTTLTAALKPLAQRGLVAVTKDAKDRRSRLLILKPAGRKVLEAAMPVWRQHHQDVERLLSSPAALKQDLAALSFP